MVFCLEADAHGTGCAETEGGDCGAQAGLAVVVVGNALGFEVAEGEEFVEGGDLGLGGGGSVGGGLCEGGGGE